MQVLTRSEQKTMDTWDLGSLFENDAAWEAAVEELRSFIKEIPSYKGSLKAGRESLLKTMAFHAKVGILAERVSSYAFLNWASDTSNPANVERSSISSTLMTELGAALAFFDPELLSIDEEVMNGYLADEAFEPYKVFLMRSMRYKAHVLSEREERIMALQRESAQTPRNAFSDLTNIDFDFGRIGDKPLTQSTFSSFLMSEDRALRKKAYKQFYSRYNRNRHTLFRLYEGQVKQDIFRHTVRSYPSSREMSLFADDVPTGVYDRLIESVHAGLPVLHRYYELRKKILGVRNLAHWDVYVPLVSGVKAHTPYEEAVKIIGEALKPLGNEYVDTLTRGLTIERWVDRYENKGKRSGAFSSGSYTGYPYILMNYKEDVLRDLFTLAHEGGHSMHSYYSARNNPFHHWDYSIFEAEVASTFNEQLVANYMIESTDDVQTKRYIIAKQLDDVVATLFRQTMFAEFEHKIHKKAEASIPLTLDLVRSTYGDLLRQYFGPGVTFINESNLEGLRIPHFYSPFYVYKYATGLSAAIALSKEVLGGGEEERARYLRFLSNGGRYFPIENLKQAGVDMSTGKPVDDAIAHFAQRLELFETLS